MPRYILISSLARSLSIGRYTRPSFSSQCTRISVKYTPARDDTTASNEPCAAEYFVISCVGELIGRTIASPGPWTSTGLVTGPHGVGAVDGTRHICLYSFTVNHRRNSQSILVFSFMSQDDVAMQGLEETALVDENLATALKAMASGVASGVGRFYVFDLHRCIATNSSHDWQDAMDPLLNELLKSSHSLPATNKEALNRFILPDGSWDRDKLCITSGKPFAGLQEHDHLGWVQRIFGANLPLRCRNSALNHQA
jgi:hypothetical protein